MVIGLSRAGRAGFAALCVLAITAVSARGEEASARPHQSILNSSHTAQPSPDLDRLGVELASPSVLLEGIKIPATIGGDSLVDTMSFLHPTVVYFPGSFCGYKLWGAFSLGVDATARHKLPNENSIIRVSNDGLRWISFSVTDSGRVKSCPEPMFSETDCLEQGEIATHFSDPFLFTDLDGRLWLGTRANYNQHQKIVLWLRSTTDGVTWSRPIRALEGSYLAPDYDALLMSPTVWRDAEGHFVMWVVDIAAISPRPQTRIKLFRADRPEGPWRPDGIVTERGTDGALGAFPCGVNTADTTDDSLFTGRYVPWHVGLVDGSQSKKLILITAVNQSMPLGARPRYYEFLGITDDGRTLQCAQKPFLGAGAYSETATPEIPGTRHVYRASGWISHEGDEREVNLLYSLQLEPVSQKDQGWRTALTTVRLSPALSPSQESQPVIMTKAGPAARETGQRENKKVGK